MTPQKEDSIKVRLERAKALVKAFERGDEQEADRILDGIATVRETLLFQEVGRLARQLHDAMAGFALDARIAKLAEKEIPDAKERLNYVISMTEQAANTTLNAIEAMLPLAENLLKNLIALAQQWDRLRQRETAFEEFKQLDREITNFFNLSRTDLEMLQTHLNEILMAQGFQDLTGQIIRRVIDLVRDVELSMVEMIRISGGKVKECAREASDKPVLAGPPVPGLDDYSALRDQDDVDELLSSLGF